MEGAGPVLQTAAGISNECAAEAMSAARDYFQRKILVGGVRRRAARIIGNTVVVIKVIVPMVRAEEEAVRRLFQEDLHDERNATSYPHGDLVSPARAIVRVNHDEKRRVEPGTEIRSAFRLTCVRQDIQDLRTRDCPTAKLRNHLKLTTETELELRSTTPPIRDHQGRAIAVAQEKGSGMTGRREGRADAVGDPGLAPDPVRTPKEWNRNFLGAVVTSRNMVGPVTFSENTMTEVFENPEYGGRRNMVRESLRAAWIGRVMGIARSTTPARATPPASDAEHVGRVVALAFAFDHPRARGPQARPRAPTSTVVLTPSRLIPDFVIACARTGLLLRAGAPSALSRPRPRRTSSRVSYWRARLSVSLPPCARGEISPSRPPSSSLACGCGAGPRAASAFRSRRNHARGSSSFTLLRAMHGVVSIALRNARAVRIFERCTLRLGLRMPTRGSKDVRTIAEAPHRHRARAIVQGAGVPARGALLDHAPAVEDGVYWAIASIYYSDLLRRLASLSPQSLLFVQSLSFLWHSCPWLAILTMKGYITLLYIGQLCGDPARRKRFAPHPHPHSIPAFFALKSLRSWVFMRAMNTTLA
ncbi:hypothetical protein DFH09DRAFT_1073073 [Mycena vulgaris]|nr:hypothetical protein DFH09DRAFT_1073073 [Mycena vulgaris]